MKKPGETLVLIGGGGHCRSCIDVIEQQGIYVIKGILDIKDKVGTKVLGYPVIGTDEDIDKLVKEGCHFLVALGHISTSHKRIEAYERIKSGGGSCLPIISPRAYISRHAAIGEGTMVMHHALINAGVSVGNNCIVNTGAIVEHDALIGDHCHIAPGAIVNGGVRIGAHTFFGSGAVSRENICIAGNSFIKAQSIVTKSSE